MCVLPADSHTPPRRSAADPPDPPALDPVRAPPPGQTLPDAQTH